MDSLIRAAARALVAAGGVSDVVEWRLYQCGAYHEVGRYRWVIGESPNQG
jgi:hypothetical protein